MYHFARRLVAIICFSSYTLYSMHFKEHPFDTLSKQKIHELEVVYDDAPRKAKRILRRLQHPDAYPEWSSTFFLGDPGTGKTTTARSIAYKAYKSLGWDNVTLKGTKLLGKHRNGTAIVLQKMIGSILQEKEDTLIIIDELNKLFEHHDNEHYDSDMAATAFWSMLDALEERKDLFLIGVMNEGDGLPQQIKDRMRGRWVLFKALTNDRREKIFYNRFNTPISQLHPECNKKFVHTLVTKKLSDWNPRSFKELALEAIAEARTDDIASERVVITKQHIIDAVDEIGTLDKKVSYGKDKPSKDDIKHQENMAMQEKHHKENMAMQKQHFVQNMLIQVDSSPTRGLCDYLNDKVFSVEQIDEARAIDTYYKRRREAARLAAEKERRQQRRRQKESDANKKHLKNHSGQCLVTRINNEKTLILPHIFMPHPFWYGF